MTILGTLGTFFVAHARALPLVIVAACGASDEPTGSLQSSACRNRAHNEYVVELTGTAFSEEDGSRIHAITDVALAEPGASGTLCRTTPVFERLASLIGHDDRSSIIPSTPSAA